jgi:hypothetical protein
MFSLDAENQEPKHSMTWGSTRFGMSCVFLKSNIDPIKESNHANDVFNNLDPSLIGFVNEFGH